MSPIRRYLRITKYSVLEVRIYLEKPSDAPWLLSPRDPVLARIIEEVRPLVLPKLREENENAKRKTSKKQRGIKDVVDREDFEITIFLTDLSSRHSLLTKQKHFADKPRIKSNGNKLTSWLNNSDNPIHIDDDERPPAILQEDEDVQALREIPEIGEAAKRKASTTDLTEEEENEPLFVSSDDEEFFATQRERTRKRRRKRTGTRESDTAGVVDQPEDLDDKKKLALNTSYDGFSIYGRILCLLVKRKGKRAQVQGVPAGGSQMMEQWVSTQAEKELGLDEDEDG